jgi:hypothetical protein
MRLCRSHGIHVFAGLMLSPTVDDAAYIEAIPDFLEDSELRVPAFISLETPFPGTPYFERLAREQNALLPGALLRDFSGYTLVVKPQHLPAKELVERYARLIDRVYGLPARLKKIAAEAPRLLAGGHWDAALLDTVDTLGNRYHSDPERSYLGGSDRAPPERVPLTDADFASAAMRADVLEPWTVTDAHGTIMAQWFSGARVYGRRGAVAASAATPHHLTAPLAGGHAANAVGVSPVVRPEAVTALGARRPIAQGAPA